MISVDEMKKLLEKDFGIKTELELNEALRKKGGIRIGVFTDKLQKKAEQVPTVA